MPQPRAPTPQPPAPTAGPATPATGEALRGGASQVPPPPQPSSEPRPSAPLVSPTAWSRQVQGVKPELARLQYREVTPEDYELLCLLDDDVTKKGRKTPEALVARLPRFRAGDCGASECQVCLMAIDADTEVIRLPCQHLSYHPECITQWLTGYTGVCPLCQTAVEPPLSPPGSVDCITGSSVCGEACVGQGGETISVDEVNCGKNQGIQHSSV
mmetsp:Transcript_31412/g.83640  ORF Transcript_31412/g.83640 Transcript_31412/m.83640 type:complete len:214 (+) Transcript_31412:2-643(+)